MSGTNGGPHGTEHVVGLAGEVDRMFERFKALLSSPLRLQGGAGKSPALRVENGKEGIVWGRSVLLPRLEVKISELRVFLDELEERLRAYAEKNAVPLETC